MKRVGRNIIKNEKQYSKFNLKLSIMRRILYRYYFFRLERIGKRKSKYASFSSGYRLDLFNANVALENFYIYKIESLYSKQELREYERRVKDEL